MTMCKMLPRKGVGTVPGVAEDHPHLGSQSAFLRTGKS